MQETNLFLNSDGRPDEPGYKGWSFGAVGGYEIPRTPLGILGVTFGASTNQIYPDKTEATENLHATLFDAGAYWRMTTGGFSANARLAGEYIRVTSDRVVAVLGGDGLAVNEISHARWSGWAVNAGGMASYEAHLGRNVYVRPQVNIDYIRLVEGAYDESGGGPGMDLAVGSRTSSRLSAFAGVAVGALYGPDKSWGPEVLVGYQGVANQVLGDTTARYVAGGDYFTLHADNISGQGPAARLSVKGENGSGGFALESGAEARDGLNIYDLRLPVTSSSREPARWSPVAPWAPTSRNRRRWRSATTSPNRHPPLPPARTSPAGRPSASTRDRTSAEIADAVSTRTPQRADRAVAGQQSRSQGGAGGADGGEGKCPGSTGRLLSGGHGGLLGKPPAGNLRCSPRR